VSEKTVQEREKGMKERKAGSFIDNRISNRTDESTIHLQVSSPVTCPADSCVLVTDMN
jgi:hypothetical protein